MEIGAQPPVKVLRPCEYDSFPVYEPAISESCLNRFKMVIDPLYMDRQRASWSFKAPGNSLLASHNAFIEASFKITTHVPAGEGGNRGRRVDYRTQTGPTVQMGNRLAVEASGAVGAVENTVTCQQMAKLAFASGCGFSQALTNVQLVVNGASLSNSRQNDYVQALDLAWLSKDTMQKRFSRCGGMPTQYDSVCCSGRTFAHDVANGASGLFTGTTGDSGIEKRCVNLIASTTSIEAPTGGGDAVRIIRIRAPLRACGVFCPVSWFDKMSDSCPFRQSCVAIPNLNSVSIDLLFSGLEECVVRSLGVAGVTVELMTEQNKPTLHVEYLRLDGSRFKPKYLAIPAFKIAVHDPTKTDNPETEIAPANSTRDNINRALAPLMTAKGYGRTTTGRSAPFGSFGQKSTMECTWQVSSAQPAPYLAFLASKSTDQLCNAERIVSTYGYNVAALPDDATRIEGSLQQYKLSRNTNACASIQKFSLEIASTVGSYTYSSETFPFLRSRDELWSDIQKYVVEDFCNNDINVWKKHNSIVLLGVDSFIRGLSTSNTSYPLQYKAVVQFGSEREWICGSAGVAKDEDIYGPVIHRDSIFSKPVMLEIFDKVSLKLSPGGAIVTSQNLSHSQAMSEIHMKKQVV